MGQLNEDYHLIIAGECYGSFEKYQALIDASPAKERIFIHCEYISDEEIPIYFLSGGCLGTPYPLRHSKRCRILAYNYEFTYVKYSRRRISRTASKSRGTGIVVPEISATALAQGIEELFTPSQQATIPANISKEKSSPLRGKP